MIVACLAWRVNRNSSLNGNIAISPAGNHDLEGDEFETDPANLAAWHQAFGQSHYWAVELGPAIAVGMSTVRFRSNNFRCAKRGIDSLGMLDVFCHIFGLTCAVSARRVCQRL